MVLISVPSVVGQQDTATSAQNQPIHETQTYKCSWKIENFSSLGIKQIFSNLFEVGGYKWRVCLYPKGNSSDCLSMYLDVTDAATLPHGWRIDTQFELALINQLRRESTIRRGFLHKFHATESDWGSKYLIPLMEFFDSSRGFLVNDTCIIEANVAVIRDCDLIDQIGKDVYFDLVDHQKVRDFHMKKHTPFNLFKEVLDKEFGVPVQFQRFWFWEKRQNQTYRPSRPLTSEEEKLHVGQLCRLKRWSVNKELRLFLEVELRPDGIPVCPPDRTKDDILLFFKFYDPKNEELRYIGRLFVKSYCNPNEILTKLNKMVGFNADKEIELYEEINFEPNVICTRVVDSVTWVQNEIVDGDIICFQKASSEEEDQCRFRSVPSFLQYLHTCQIIHFRHLSKPAEDDFCIKLSKKFDTYDNVVEKMAFRLGLDDPSKIRLIPHDSHSHQPKSDPIKYCGAQHLKYMLTHDNQTTEILYYEVLDIPLPELECSKTLKLAFCNPSNEVTMHEVIMIQQNNVGDLLDELKARVELSHPIAELRLLQVLNNKINKVDVLETHGHAEARVEPAMELTAVPGIEKRKDHGPPGGPLAVLLAKKARVSTFASQGQIGQPPSESSPPLSKASGTPPLVVPPLSSPQQNIMTKGCVPPAIQSADVIAGQALQSGLESFSGMLQAMQKYKIQLDRQSKKLDNLQKASTSLTIAKVKAEDALKSTEEKASVVEAESAALKAKLKEFQAKEQSWEAQLKAQKVKFEAELSSALNALEKAEASTKAKEDELAQEKASRASEACCQKAREKALEEFGAEVGGLVNNYHLACHIRSLTLAGLEPKDPRWYDVAFPIEGPTPPLKFPWEDERGSAGEPTTISE